MPSYRARLQIGDLLPGHRPEEVMDLAEAHVAALDWLVAQDGPVDRVAEEVGWAAVRGVDEMVADLWRWQEANPGGYRPM